MNPRASCILTIEGIRDRSIKAQACYGSWKTVGLPPSYITSTVRCGALPPAGPTCSEPGNGLAFSSLLKYRYCCRGKVLCATPVLVKINFLLHPTMITVLSFFSFFIFKRYPLRKLMLLSLCRVEQQVPLSARKRIPPTRDRYLPIRDSGTLPCLSWSSDISHLGDEVTSGGDRSELPQQATCILS